MRCLALAQAWQDRGGRTTFLTVSGIGTLEERLKSEGMGIVHVTARPGSAEDATQTGELARSLEAQWVVLDGYHFDGAYQRVLKDGDLHVMAIDDNGHAEHYYSDIVMNQNLHAREELYERRESYTRLLLGTAYVLLRREFWRWRGWSREIPRVATDVLITLGGSDRAGMTERVIEALEDMGTKRMRVEIVVGERNPRLREIETAMESVSTRGRVRHNVSDMASLMARADIAVAASGITSWELAFMGVPTIAIVLAENQAPIAETLEAEGVVINTGWYSKIPPGTLSMEMMGLLQSPENRRRMRDRGKTLVDGYGTERVVEEIGTHDPEMRGRI